MPDWFSEVADITGLSPAEVHHRVEHGGLELTAEQCTALENRMALRKWTYFSEQADEGDYLRALSQLDSQDVAAGIVTLDVEYGLSNDDLRAVLRVEWTRCDAHRHVVEELLDLFRRAGYVSSPERRFEGAVTIYRGNLGEDPRHGISWTLSKAKARRFALYALGPRGQWLGLDRADDGEPVPTVWQATVSPDAILGYFNDRREREVIVNPAKVKSVSVALRPRVAVESSVET